MNFKYKVGEKVRVLDGSEAPYYTAGWINPMNRYVGKTLAVMTQESIHESPTYKLVDGGGWSYDEKYLAPATSDRIVIYTDKKDPSKVIAKDVSTGKAGVAKCSPEDTFDFYTGAKLAMERLLGVEKMGTDEKIEEIEIGDTVEFISCQVGVFYPGYGDKGVVKDIDLDGDLWVLWEGKDNAWCCGTEKVRLVSKRYTTSSGFKIGDYVIGLGDSPYLVTTTDTIWKVVYPNEFTKSAEIRVYSPGDTSQYNVSPKYFKRVNPSELGNYSMVCVKDAPDKSWGVGKIYKLENGVCRNKHNFPRGYFTTPEQMSKATGAAFIKVIE